MAVSWSDSMKVGVEPIDQQHERLVGMLCELQEQGAAMGQAKLRRLLVDLVSYTQYHFRTEENLMRSRAWPTYESHKADHDHYRTRLIELERRVTNGHDLTAVPEIETILERFVNDHVLGTDRETWVDMKQRGLV